jgi:copper chaperone NosL
MKRIYGLSLVVAVSFVFGGLAFAEQTNHDISLHKSCNYCGMDRGVYHFSRMLITYDDGTAIPFCSIHCAAVDLANNIDKGPQVIEVGDFTGGQLLDAEKAFWVVGGNKPGVMSRRGKWAFEKKEDAENFVKTNQGKIVSFEEAMKMAYEDMYEDTKAIRERRKLKRMQRKEHK